MASLSDYLAGQLATWAFTASAATRPASWYLALFTAAPSSSGGGTEVAGGGYVRQPATLVATGAVDSNSNTLTFTASGADFGTVTHAALFDAVSGGNMLCFTALAAPQTIVDGQSLAVSPSNLTMSFA